MPDTLSFSLLTFARPFSLGASSSSASAASRSRFFGVGLAMRVGLSALVFRVGLGLTVTGSEVGVCVVGDVVCEALPKVRVSLRFAEVAVVGVSGGG